MDYRILSIRTYQAASLEGKSWTHFTTINAKNGKPQCQMKILEGIGVLVKTDKDAVIIPFPNISGIYLDTDIKMEKREERRADREKPAKAQSVKGIKNDPIGAKRL
jgi:hypothetical protein